MTSCVFWSGRRPTERSEILERMTTLQIAGMRPTYDEIVSKGILDCCGTTGAMH